MGNNKKAVISVTALLLAVQFFHNAEDIIAMIRFFSFSIFMYKDFSVPTERAAITAGDDLRGLGTCHQQAFWQEYRKRIPAKIRNLTEDCIACHLVESQKMFLHHATTLID